MSVPELRSRFPILQEKTYLYSCSQGALSDVVEAGAEQYARSWRNSSAPWDEWVDAYEAMRVEFARFINAGPDEVAVVTSASAAINPIASALAFNGRNRVVMGEYEFPTMGHIWLAQRKRGAQIEFLDGIDNAIPVECYEKAINERTLVVPISQVSFLNGFRPDIAAVTEIAHSRGALVFLDGYQDCGTRPVDVKELDVDFFVTGTLKYLLGPPGLGFLYVRRSLLDSLVPTVTSWMGQRDVFAFNTRNFDLAPAARRFETGTPPIPNIYMARPALDLLACTGMTTVATQIERLTCAFVDGARDLGIDIKTPLPSVGPLVVLRAKEPASVIANLAAHRIVASVRQDGVRFSFHAYNTFDDVEHALSVLEENIDLMVRA